MGAELPPRNPKLVGKGEEVAFSPFFPIVCPAEFSLLVTNGRLPHLFPYCPAERAQNMEEDAAPVTTKELEDLFNNDNSPSEEELPAVKHDKWVDKTLAIIRKECKTIAPALRKAALHFCDRIESSASLSKKQTLLLRFIYLRKFDKTGLAGTLYEEVFDPKHKNRLLPWVFPAALRVTQDYRKRKSGLALLPVRLTLATLDMAELYDGEQVLTFLPHSFLDGNEFVMWFSENIMYPKKKKTALRRRKRPSGQPHLSDSSSASSSDDGFFLGSSSEDESEVTYQSVGGDQTSALLHATSLDLSEDSNLSDEPDHPASKVSQYRRKWEEAKEAYQTSVQEFNSHILKYPLFRALVKAHFHEVGFRVNFQDKEMRCHELNSQGSVVNNTVENAWPLPQEYNLCSHHKNTSTNPFQVLQVNKQPQLRSVVRMAVYPDERLNSALKNHTPLFKKKGTQI